MAPAALPVWAINTALAVTVAGTAYAGYQAYQTSRFNEKVAANEAQYQRQKADLEEKKHVERLKKKMAQGKVAVAKSGGTLLSATAEAVFTENLQEGLFDAAMIRYQGDRNVESALAQKELAGHQGNAALINTATKIGSTVLTNSTAKSASASPGAQHARDMVGAGVVP